MANQSRAELPHLQLTCLCGLHGRPSAWRFVVRDENGAVVFEAEDEEPGVWGERLELLTVVRGLESIDAASRVTVLCQSCYVKNGVRYGLSEWRENGWRWESYGQWTPVKNAELWQRLDRLQQCHDLTFALRRIDQAHGSANLLLPRATRTTRKAANFAHWIDWVKSRAASLVSWARKGLASAFSSVPLPGGPSPLGEIGGWFEWEQCEPEPQREAA